MSWSAGAVWASWLVICWREPAPRGSRYRNCSTISTNCRTNRTGELDMLPLLVRRSRRQDSTGAPLPPQISPLGVAVFIICLAIGAIPLVLYQQPVPMIVAVVIGLYCLFAIKVAEQWQIAAVLRLSRYIGLRGRG